MTQPGIRVIPHCHFRAQDAFTHATNGWLELHRIDQMRALEHFRCAMRADPLLEHARVGMQEALKARYWVYRLYIRWVLLIERWAFFVQLAVLIVLFFGTWSVLVLARNWPGASPILWTIWGFVFAFGMMTRLTFALFNSCSCETRKESTSCQPPKRHRQSS